MTVPDYFQRNAVAISQAISGLDQAGLESTLKDVCVGVRIGPDALGSEGRALADLLVRLLARLYPALVVCGEGAEPVADLVALARRINPRIGVSGQPTVEVMVGCGNAQVGSSRKIFAGSDGWAGRVSVREPQGCGASNNPFGAGVAACLAAAELFRSVFLPGVAAGCDVELTIPEGIGTPGEGADVERNVGDLVLAGGGAIGNAAAWALARTDVVGSLEVVDHENVDLGNLQRYVLSERDDEGKPKASALAAAFSAGLNAKGFECRLAEYLQMKRHGVENLLLALDSGKDRCAAQASLPLRIANAWTQPGDLGVSVHDFLEGACVSCLYLPDSVQKNEDEIIAEAFGVPDKLMDVRVLLHNGGGAPRSLLEDIASAGGLEIEKLLPFEGRPLRALYTEGFCGGAVIPLDQMGAPTNEVHVPLAHQSALAGVLLAAAGVSMGLNGSRGSLVARYDVLKPQSAFHVHPAAKNGDGMCICEDDDYRDVYRMKLRGGLP